MAFESLAYDLATVDLVGDALIGYADAIESLQERQVYDHIVLDNWRAAHGYPLNTFQTTLRYRAKTIDSEAVVAQRSKRATSIVAKLERYPDLRLSEIQDIAGCRAILSNVDQVYQLVKMYKSGYSHHVLIDEDDYIRKPKNDGYRSYHLIYRYANPSRPEYVGRKIEIQIRSQLQHCSATAVETVDTFLREGLKAHRGSPPWRRFFALMASAIALGEGCRAAPKTPKNEQDIRKELRQLVDELGVNAKLTAFGDTLRIAGEASTRRLGIKYIILALDLKDPEPVMDISGYLANEYQQASAYNSAREADGMDSVLVAVSDAASLRSAYPNYFFDTRFFVSWMNQFLEATS